MIRLSIRPRGVNTIELLGKRRTHIEGAQILRFIHDS